MEELNDLSSLFRSMGIAFGVSKIVLFGSQARGNHSHRSDIHLAVYGLEVSRMGAFRLELEELPTLLKFDVVAVDQETNPVLLAEINRDGVILYESV